LTPAERGFLLLTCKLGDPGRRVLTAAQLRTLAARAGVPERSAADRPITEKDLLSLGYGREDAQRILSLLGQEALLQRYLEKGAGVDCTPVTRASAAYPILLRQRVGLDSPGSLWLKGDASILNRPAVALVGSRDLHPQNRVFAREVGRQAAVQGLVLISGNARGADREAQDSCLDAGGQVVSIVADELWRQPLRKNVLYVSEEGFDIPFSSQRALSRNRCIHAMGLITFVAQVSAHKGGTWDGTCKNLSHGWSPVACFQDGSPGAMELEQMGAYLIGKENLLDFGALPRIQTLF